MAKCRRTARACYSLSSTKAERIEFVAQALALACSGCAYNCELCSDRLKPALQTGVIGTFDRARLRMLADHRSCGQSGHYPERQIYQQQINCKRRSPVQPQISRAAHRQKEQEQCE